MIKNISVLGAGTMGHGIAEVFAMGGFDVSLYETNEEVRNNVKGTIEKELELLAEYDIVKKEAIPSILDRITLFSDLKAAVESADFVIEATPELMELKQNLFKELDEYCKKEAILASNTSSLALSEMTKLISEERKNKVMVCHWYNPAHLMPLVELSYFGNMEEETFIEIENMFKQAEKVTIRVNKDIPGLVANRIQQGVAREAFWLIQNDVASTEDIDKALKFGPAFRYATTGQLEVTDMGGLDIWAAVGDNLLSVMDNRQSANPILRAKVEEGKLGIKTGEGFFKYPPERAAEVKEAFNRRLILQLKASKDYL